MTKLHPANQLTSRRERRRRGIARSWGVALSCLALAVALPFLATGCGDASELTYTSLDLGDVPLATATRGPIEVTIDEVGVLHAARQVPVKSPFGAQVAWIAADGITVAEGDVVARLEAEQLVEDIEGRINELKLTRADIEKSIEQLEQAIRSRSLDVEKAMAGLEFDRTRLIDLNRSLETLETLAELSLVPRTEVDTAERQWESRKLQTYQSDLSFQKSSETSDAEQTLQQSRLGDLNLRGRRGMRRVSELQERIDSSIVKAPAAGTWMVARNWNWQAGGERPVAAGQEVHSGHMIGQIAQSDNFGVKSQVSESKISLVQNGSRAWVSSATLGEERLAARVTRLGFAAIPREMSPGGAKSTVTDFSGLKVFEVDLEMEEDDPRLANGMTVDVSIVTDERDNAVSIPAEALYRSEGVPVVFIQTPTGPEQRTIVPGSKSSDRIIVDDGLNGGERLYLADLNDKLDRLNAQRRPRGIE